MNSQQLNHSKKIQELQFVFACSITCDLAMKWKLLILAALVTAAVVLISGNLFEIASGRKERSNEIVPVDFPTASPTTADVTPETPSEKPAAWDPWANSDGSFEELKLARVPSANELLRQLSPKRKLRKLIAHLMKAMVER